jgi:hypothetical protein
MCIPIKRVVWVFVRIGFVFGIIVKPGFNVQNTIPTKIAFRLDFGSTAFTIFHDIS